jgi:hypothetical protein
VACSVLGSGLTENMHSSAGGTQLDEDSVYRDRPCNRVMCLYGACLRERGSVGQSRSVCTYLQLRGLCWHVACLLVLGVCCYYVCQDLKCRRMSLCMETCMHR